jgi:hypothetical protein
MKNGEGGLTIYKKPGRKIIMIFLPGFLLSLS